KLQNGGPVLAGNLTTGECGVGPNAGNFDACAITNTAASNAPASWGYVPKSGTPGVFPPQSFFEGGVNLNKIFGAGNVPCFSSFLSETRSSSSITATLKDFAEGSFNLCKITVTKNCNFVGVINDGTALQYTFSGTLTNNGPGTVYDVELVDVGNDVVVQVGVSGQVTNNGNTRLSGITLAHNPATTVNLTSSTLNPGESTSWSATYQPADISSGDGTIPGRYFFDDTIRV